MAEVTEGRREARLAARGAAQPQLTCVKGLLAAAEERGGVQTAAARVLRRRQALLLAAPTSRLPAMPRPLAVWCSRWGRERVACPIPNFNSRTVEMQTILQLEPTAYRGGLNVASSRTL